MSTKYNHGRGGKKAKGFGGSGMLKHARSGVSHNHRITIEMNRDAARRFEEEAQRRAKRKGEMYSSVREAFRALTGRRKD